MRRGDILVDADDDVPSNRIRKSGYVLTEVCFRFSYLPIVASSIKSSFHHGRVYSGLFLAAALPTINAPPHFVAS